jgi:hypothetical protein
VVGILDIAKCLYEAITKIEQEYNDHSKNLEEAVKKVCDVAAVRCRGCVLMA